MKAAVFYERNGPLIVEEIQIDAPKRTKMLVKVAASGAQCDCVLKVLRRFPAKNLR